MPTSMSPGGMSGNSGDFIISRLLIMDLACQVNPFPTIHGNCRLLFHPLNTLVNVNAPVVATTSWWLHFSAPVVALKVKNLYLLTL